MSPVRDRKCKREGCNRWAPVDVFCSRYCLEVHTGARDERPMTRSEKEARRRRAQNGPETVTVENTDAMTRRLPGAYGTGKS